MSQMQPEAETGTKLKKCRHCPDRFFPKNNKQVYCSDECRKEAHHYGGMNRGKLETLARKIMREETRRWLDRLEKKITARLDKIEARGNFAVAACYALAEAGQLPPAFVKKYTGQVPVLSTRAVIAGPGRRPEE